jgi:hypothetical protein
VLRSKGLLLESWGVDVSRNSLGIGVVLQLVDGSNGRPDDATIGAVTWKEREWDPLTPAQKTAGLIATALAALCLLTVLGMAAAMVITA